MNKRVVRRLLETFFRRWYLYLIPLVLFTGLGIWKSMGLSSGYRSVGVIDVSRNTLLSQLTELRGDTFGYETPATVTARTMNSLLATDRFLESVAENAGVSGAVSRGEITGAELRGSIGVATAGDELVAVQATTFDPQLSANLAKGTIQSFIDYVVTGEVSESRAAEEFFANQVALYQAEVDEAQGLLAEYARTRPGGPLDERPLDEQLEIERLTSGIDRATSRLSAAQAKSEEARLATEQSTGDVRQRLRIVDDPEIPLAPQPYLRTAAMNVVLFAFVGLLLSLAAVVLGTVTDRTLRTPEDVEQVLKLRLLAAVPEVGRTKARHKAKETVDAGVATPLTSEARSPVGTATVTEITVEDPGLAIGTGLLTPSTSEPAVRRRGLARSSA